jgi:hypothetical protein
MSRTETVKEYMLASVYIPKLSTSITQSNITDTRADTTVCGWVTGIIDQVDTATLFAQWKAAYDEAVAEMDAALAVQQQTFERWYADLTDNYTDGTGLPIPNATDAGKIPTVSETGGRYTLVAPDTTLSKPGQTADAAAVAAALAKKAPAGLVAEEITITVAGQFETELKRIYAAMHEHSTRIVVANLLIQDGLPGGFWHITMHKTNDNYGKITAETYTPAGNCHMTIYDGNWNEWEYENPPLLPGVEYRTTERRIEKPVYAKLINVGTLPNSSKKSFSLMLNGVGYICYSMLYAVGNGAGFTIPFGIGEANACYWIDTGRNLHISTSADLSAYNAYAELRYTKE